MKRIRLLLAVLFAPLVFQVAVADDVTDVSRAAVRRNIGQTTTANRGKTTKSDARANQNTAASRGVPSGTVGVRERTTRSVNTSRNENVIVDKSRANVSKAGQKSVVARATSNVQSRSANVASRVSTRKSQSSEKGTLRSRATVKGNAYNINTDALSRTASKMRPTIFARAGVDTDMATAISGRDFSACKTVFYDCMDEFCANKDAGLKRCACSSRASEFDDVKKQLAKAEDKLLDFSQRLLTVSMDKEDALALNTATQGEIAFSDKDDSESKKILDNIAKKLNASFDDDNLNQNLNAITLSLDTSAAFDDIDSMMGANTTTKSGVALYNDALPICREMALEVCAQADVAIVESGYQMAIEQDCNTVAKSYAAQTDQARAKILESSALLDISRLNKHQEQNSDDILTCKKKMLAVLNEDSVCGKDLSGCLDTTGRYIDPSTGEAFLTNDLSGLANLIVRPDADAKWQNVPDNKGFVSFLNSKKAYLEPAMKNCQDISNLVWDEFIEDALAQIKLAQESKLEQVRQSCTTLTTQCLNEANDNISEFDARALSIFGVKADVTVNAMCASVRNACTALIDAGNDMVGDDSWDQGMTEIAASKSYETILKTCREVGKNCIIQVCTSMSGNFGLCENIDTSVNRKSVINRTACWNEVVNCVKDAGAETLAQIMENQGRTANADSGDLYMQLYKQESPVNDICEEDARASVRWEDFDWQACRIAEQIWGNCEYQPYKVLVDDKSTNKILVNSGSDNETLLSWFARNTNTNDKDDSCRDTTCGKGYTYYMGFCKSNEEFSSDGTHCLEDEGTKFNIYDNFTNCCASPSEYINESTCCAKTDVAVWADNPAGNQDGYASICVDNGTSVTNEVVFSQDGRQLICVGNRVEYDNDEIYCGGRFVWINNGHYEYASSGSEEEEIAEWWYEYASEGKKTDVSGKIGWFVAYPGQ